MNRNISGLDAIIRKIGKDDTVPDGYRLFLFDEDASIILKKEPSFFSLKRPGRYIVSSNEVAHIEKFSLLLDNGIGLNVSYSARCRAGSEAEVLLSLFDKEKIFESVLNEKLGYFVRDCMYNNGRKITHQALKQIENEISQKYVTETGLLISPVITFQREANLKKLPLKSDAFTVRVNDYNGSLNLEYETEILPLETDLEIALKRDISLDDLKQKLNEIIYDEIWKNATLNQFWLALNDRIKEGEGFEMGCSIKELVAKPVNTFLAEEGRQMGFLRLKSSSLENIVPPDLLDIDHTYSYKIADDNEDVVVKNNISLKLTNVSLYKKAEDKHNIKKYGKNFKEWFAENVVTPIVKILLFSKKYEDILIDSDIIEKQIKYEISAKAQELGFNIQQHIYMPKIKNLGVKRGFELTLENASFKTKSSSFDIKFNVKIKGKITDLRFLKNKGLLSPKLVIEDDIRNSVRSLLEYKIFDLPPENIYLRNESASSLGQQKKVEEDLQSAVIEFLVKSYFVEESSLVVIINFSEKEDIVHKAYEQLKKNKITFQVCCTPSNKEVICFKIIYEITGIRSDGWERFSNQISKKTEDIIAEMAVALENRISADLNNYSYKDILQYTAKEIQARTFVQAFNDVSETFGLYVLINSSKRLQTGMETGILDINKKKIEKLVTELTNDISVENDHQRLVMEGYKGLLKDAIKDKDFELVEQIQNKISKIEESIKISVTKSTNSLGYIAEAKENSRNNTPNSGDDYVDITPDEDK